MSVDIRRRSRLNFADLRQIDGVEFWDTFEPPTLRVQADDIQYRVSGTDRIDSLAYKFYGDPILWWVIAVANDLELLPTDLNEGMTLRIPSARYVQQVLFAKTK